MADATPPPTRRAQALVAVWLGLGLGYEGWALTNGVPGDTVSAAVWDWGARHPDFRTGTLLVVGALLLHFFGGWRQAKDPA